jgi:hypothetical protein
MDIPAILHSIRPGSVWQLDGDDYAGLNWLDDSPKPTKKTLEDAWPQVEYEREKALVEAERRARYQQETDGLFFAAQREGGDLTGWQAAVDAIKADLPYPEMPAG